MKSSYDEFKQNMTKLCIAYNFTFPINQLNAAYLEYYTSPLGDLETSKFTQVIDKAKRVISCKCGIPQISELISLIPGLDQQETTNYNECRRCNKTGVVTMIAPDGYEYAFACDCKAGIFRQQQNRNKKEAGEPRFMTCYTKALLHGYKIRKYVGLELSEEQKKKAEQLINILQSKRNLL